MEKNTTNVVCQSMGIDPYTVRAHLAQYSRHEGVESSTFHIGLAMSTFLCLGVVTTMTVLGDEDGHLPEVQAQLNVLGGIASQFERAERAEAPVSAVEGCFEERCGRS